MANYQKFLEVVVLFEMLEMWSKREQINDLTALKLLLTRFKFNRHSLNKLTESLYRPVKHLNLCKLCKFLCRHENQTMIIERAHKVDLLCCVGLCVRLMAALNLEICVWCQFSAVQHVSCTRLKTTWAPWKSRSTQKVSLFRWWVWQKWEISCVS